MEIFCRASVLGVLQRLDDTPYNAKSEGEVCILMYSGKRFRIAFGPTFKLSNNRFGVEPCKLFNEALKYNDTLTTLKLPYAWLDDHGAIGLAEVMKTNTLITSLDITCLHMNGNGGLNAIMEMIKVNSTLTKLNLNQNSIGNSAKSLLESLRENTTIKSLSVYFNEFRHEIALFGEFLKSNSTLTSLNLGANYAEDNGAKSLSNSLRENTTLTTLKLSRSGIRDISCFGELLRVNSTLTALDFAHNSIVDLKFFFESLKANSTLTSLNLAYNCINEKSFESLSDLLTFNTTIQSIELSDVQVPEEIQLKLASIKVVALVWDLQRIIWFAYLSQNGIPFMSQTTHLTQNNTPHLTKNNTPHLTKNNTPRLTKNKTPRLSQNVQKKKKRKGRNKTNTTVPSYKPIIFVWTLKE